MDTHSDKLLAAGVQGRPSLLFKGDGHFEAAELIELMIDIQKSDLDVAIDGESSA